MSCICSLISFLKFLIKGKTGESNELHIYDTYIYIQMYIYIYMNPKKTDVLWVNLSLLTVNMSSTPEKA